MNTEKITPQMQSNLSQIQQIQQQVQSISMQRSQIKLIIQEIELSLKEIEKLKDNDDGIYKLIGNLIFKSKKDDVKSELYEKKESMSIREQTLQRQEERLTDRFKQLQEQLRSMIKEKEKE